MCNVRFSQLIPLTCFCLAFLVSAGCSRSVELDRQRAAETLRRVEEVLDPEELRSWARPFLARAQQGELVPDSEMVIPEKMLQAGVGFTRAQLVTDAVTGSRFVYVKRRAMPPQGLLIGLENAAPSQNKHEILLKWVDGIYYSHGI